MPTLETYHGYPLWHYIPSLPAAAVFAVLFALATALQGYLLLRNRAWFCLPFVIGGVFEVIGYIGRALAYSATGQLVPYLLQSVLLLLAPSLFAASLYMTLSRLIRAVGGGACSIIRPRWLTRIFVFGDVFSFLMQSTGAGLLVQARTGSSMDMAEDIIIGGLIFQVAMFAVFCVTAFVFHVRFGRRRLETEDIPWRGILVMLYGTSAFIMIRNIFRTVEYAMGQDGYLLGKEWTVYVFDGILMLFTMLWFSFRYPSGLGRVKEIDAGIELSSTADHDRGALGKGHRYQSRDGYRDVRGRILA